LHFLNNPYIEIRIQIVALIAHDRWKLILYNNRPYIPAEINGLHTHARLHTLYIYHTSILSYTLSITIYHSALIQML